MEITITSTCRGFKVGKFADLYGKECSIQESSQCGDDSIWLGVDGPNLKVTAGAASFLGRKDLLKDGQQYPSELVSIPLPDGVFASTRMHLNQEQVASLLPLLQYFVDHGELPPFEIAETDPKDKPFWA